MANNESFEDLLNLLKNQSEAERFENQSDIARGGMGQVSLAVDKAINRNVAVKVLHDEMQDDQDYCAQFIDEARITGQLEHSNIVPVHTMGVDKEGKLYFTMKYVNGDSLCRVIEELQDKNKDYEDYYTQFMMLRIFRKVCDAVSFAHSKKILHRDIKPENIMIGDHGEVQLMDWGIAKYEGSEDYYLSGKAKKTINPFETDEGIIKGSPAYMTPEQARGESSSYDTRSDIFLLGATLYHMLTLKPPYYDEDVNVMVDKAEVCDFVHPAEAAPDKQLPDELCSILLKAMAQDKKDRYQTVDQLTQAIDNLMSGQIMSTKHTWKAGKDIIKLGDTGSEAYVIIEGEVEVYKKFGGKKTVYTRLHRGDVFGEMAAITDTVRSASVAALTDTTCLIITPETLTEQLHKLPPWLDKIVTALSNRLRKMDEVAHPLLVSDCTFEVCNQIKLLALCYGTVNDKSHMEYELQEIVYEVANNLKIPEDRVRPIIAGLVEIGLAEIDKSLYLSLPNWHLFSDFVEFCKDAARLSNTSTKNLTSINIQKVYTDGASLIHRNCRITPNDTVPPLKKMKPLKDAITPEKSLDYKKDFIAKLKKLNEYAAKSESLNKSQFKTQAYRRVFNPAEAPKISEKFNDA